MGNWNVNCEISRPSSLSPDLFEAINISPHQSLSDYRQIRADCGSYGIFSASGAIAAASLSRILRFAIYVYPCTKSRLYGNSYWRLRRLTAARRPLVDSFSPG